MMDDGNDADDIDLLLILVAKQFLESSAAAPLAWDGCITQSTQITQSWIVTVGETIFGLAIYGENPGFRSFLRFQYHYWCQKSRAKTLLVYKTWYFRTYWKLVVIFRSLGTTLTGWHCWLGARHTGGDYPQWPSKEAVRGVARTGECSSYV